MTAQLFAPLAPEIEAALKASIQRFGVIVPVVEDQNGNVIDGRHRRRLAEELGVTVRVDRVQVADEAEALEVQRTLNADRRQMTTEQRREIELELRKEGHSYRAIAGAVGVAHKTVMQDVKQATGTQVPVQLPARSEGLDGKSRPATRASWMPLPVSGHGALPYTKGPRDRPIVVRLDNLMSSVRAMTSFDPEKVEIGDLAVGAAVMYKREIAGAIKALGIIKRRLEGSNDQD